jgi:hypothetical protein
MPILSRTLAPAGHDREPTLLVADPELPVNSFEVTLVQFSQRSPPMILRTLSPMVELCHNAASNNVVT